MNPKAIPAPMCGIMDAPFRAIIAKFGAPMLYTEMLSSDAMNLEHRKEYTKNATKKSFENIPFVVQIAGHDPMLMANAAKIAQYECGADVIDMNFGCPVKKVVNGDAGSALMKDLKRSQEIISAVCKAVTIPVTIKMRMGWDHSNLNAPELAKISENEGIKTVTVHCRTRNQLYTGTADWKFINEVKKVVSIPVIVNGDINTIEDLKTALELSNANSAMIGRGLYGKPWLIAEMNHFLETENIINLKPENLMKEVIVPHLEMIEDHYSKNPLGFAIKHLYFYSKGLEGGSNFRKELASAKSIKELIAISEDFF
jgi:tRNA-dihydrouridine synthase B